MRRLIGLAIFAVSTIAFGAPTLTWNPVAGAEGYNVYCGPTPIAADPVPVATVLVSHDLVSVVTPGVEMECWVTATAAGFAESPASSHVVFTEPMPSQTIVVPGQPSSVTVTWQ